MLFNQRIIHNDNGTLEDKSVELNNLYTGTATLDLALTDDYLYIGSDLPFNHRWFEVSSVNSVSSIMSVDIWDGNSWNAAVDVVDQTSATGKTLAQSGYISWTTDRSSSWGLEETTENVTGLTTLKIYNMYWVRLKVSASLTGSTAVSYVGHKFSSDDDLGGRYPDLVSSTIMDAFETGKTTWNEQHVLAAEDVIQDIRRKRIAWSANQVVNWEQFNIAAIHKVAMIIMNAFGDDYKDNRADAKKAYDEAMNLKIFEVDANADGHNQVSEREPHRGIFRT
jgi:hypothetical protein